MRLVSYGDVLAGHFARGTFRGKAVVVGATDSTLDDIQGTSTGDQMTGAEVQADAIDTAAPS